MEPTHNKLIFHAFRQEAAITRPPGHPDRVRAPPPPVTARPADRSCASPAVIPTANTDDAKRDLLI